MAASIDVPPFCTGPKQGVDQSGSGDGLHVVKLQCPTVLGNTRTGMRQTSQVQSCALTTSARCVRRGAGREHFKFQTTDDTDSTDVK